jgi:nucleotidyltransferase/DNA polymerase involved in DNA repair
MFATIYLPNFYLQAATRHQPELCTQPMALIDEKEAKARIIQLNEAAEKAGVRKGMTPSQGLARCLKLVIKTRSHSQEKLIDEILLQHAFTLAPYVEATAPGVCTIQFGRQPSRLSGQTAKVSRVIEQLAECEITAQAGIANLPDASYLAARLARSVLQIDDAKKFLAPLPIETLAIALS